MNWVRVGKNCSNILYHHDADNVCQITHELSGIWNLHVYCPSLHEKSGNYTLPLTLSHVPLTLFLVSCMLKLRARHENVRVHAKCIIDGPGHTGSISHLTDLCTRNKTNEGVLQQNVGGGAKLTTCQKQNRNGIRVAINVRSVNLKDALTGSA